MVEGRRVGLSLLGEIKSPMHVHTKSWNYQKPLPEYYNTPPSSVAASSHHCGFYSNFFCSNHSAYHNVHQWNRNFLCSNKSAYFNVYQWNWLAIMFQRLVMFLMQHPRFYCLNDFSFYNSLVLVVLMSSTSFRF